MNFTRLPTNIFKCLNSVKINTMADGLKMFKRCTSMSGVPGSGVGKGGGAGGSIKESGGGLGKMGAAREESYFFDKQREQLRDIKKKNIQDKKASRPSEKKQE